MASQYQAAGPSRPYHPAHSAHPAHAAHPASAFPIPNMPQQAGWRSPAPERAGLSLGNVGSGSGSGGGGGVAMPTPSVPYARPLPQPTPAPVPASRAPQAASSSSAPLPPLPSPTEETHNPLSDLIETERSYMEQLTLVIRDLPPPKLDAMFRCVEGVYRCNRSFGAKLKDVSANPSNAKALGDLLMRWVDDLEPTYRRYVTLYLTGFDSYNPILQNKLLPGILDDVSKTSPPTPPLQRWTLDALFLLPYARLRYYRKLYTRLLQSTSEGRSDHRMLHDASRRLEALVTDIEARLECDVSEEDAPPGGKPLPTPVDAPREPSSTTASAAAEQQRSTSRSDSSVETQSVLSAFKVDSTRSSATSAATSVTQSPGGKEGTPVQTSDTPPITDLELRINPERAIDLFNMQPRKCKLQMCPPTLPFKRTILSSHDAAVFFTPTSTNQQVVHRRAHIFILTDLFLITDHMEAVDKAQKAQQVAREQPNRVGEGGPMPEMWLAYPPLAGKHLSVQEGKQTNVLAVTVMRKETFVIHTESEMERDLMMKTLNECIAFASAAPRIVATNLAPSTQTQPLSPQLPSPRGPSPAPGAPGGPGGMRFPTAQTRSLKDGAPSPTALNGTMGHLAINGERPIEKALPHPAAMGPPGAGMPAPGMPGASPRNPPTPMMNGPPQHARAMPGPGQHMPGPGQHMPGPGQHMPGPGQHMPGPGQHMPGPGQYLPGQGLPPGAMPGGPARRVSPGQQMGGFPQPMTPAHGGPPQMLSRPTTPGNRPTTPGMSRSTSVHSSHSTLSTTSAQSGPPPPPHGPGNHFQQIPIPSNRVGSGPGPSGPSLSPMPGPMSVGPLSAVPVYRQPAPFVRTPTNYSDSGPNSSNSHEYLGPPRSRSAEPSLHDMQYNDMGPPAMPSARFKTLSEYSHASSRRSQPEPDEYESPPGSPTQSEFTQLNGPTSISAQMKCKVFSQQGHGQWKALGSGKLKLYVEKGRTYVKQLVVEHSNGKSMLISTIVLTDGVERVGKTGVAVEISDRGQRTGVVYMIQLRNEESAAGLHQELLAGSDRERK